MVEWAAVTHFLDESADLRMVTVVNQSEVAVHCIVHPHLGHYQVPCYAFSYETHGSGGDPGCPQTF